MNLPPLGYVSAEPDGDVRYAVRRWDRTVRLCLIRLAERMPIALVIIWVIMRH